ncbi:hypothetical protein [Actinomadura sp. HBU206391]|uniref:hypothetical protein n=1 Tax=Actinomadura sp. HBU206391 TaxID=2731692 RepID=UPI0016509BC0|nr:hypothetical protein [Actinomadura sp. HBU206391]MBC6457063.1 hypothetical protein [Actinomadura sp. HBU206391]
MTDEHARALSHVCEALRIAPIGTRGLVHRVAFSFSLPAYVYEGLVARCRIDPGSSAAVWDEITQPPSWGNLGPLFTDPPEVLGDAIPPEAISGLADQIQQGRLQLCGPVTDVADEGGPQPWA